MDILISTTYLSPVCSFLSAVQPAWSVHLEFLHVNAYLQWPKRWLYNFSSLSSGQRHFWRPYFKTIDLNEDVLLAVFLWKFYFEASMSETFGSGSVLLKPLIVYLCSLKYDFQLHIATGHLNSKDCMCGCVCVWCPQLHFTWIFSKKKKCFDCMRLNFLWSSHWQTCTAS